MAANANLSYAASADAQLALLGTLAVTGGTGATIGGSIGSTTTSAEIKVTGNATTTAAAVKVNIYGISASTATSGTNTYTLVHGGGASNTLNNATYSLGTVYNNTNFILTNPGSAFTATATDLTVGITAVTALTAEYWKGGLSGSVSVWAASNGSTQSNWTTDGAGTATALVPSANVIFGDATATAGNQVGMTLGANMSINGLTVDGSTLPADTNPVTLNADGNKLTIGAGAITVNSGAAAVTLNAPIVFATGQVFTNNSASTLSLGAISAGINSLTLAGTGATTIGTFTSSAGLTVSSGTVTLAGTAALAGAQTWTNNSSSTLTVSGNISNSTFLLTVAGTGNTTISGTIGNGSGGLAMTGSGTLTISGINTFTGGTTVGSGVLQISGAGTLGAATGALAVNGTGILDLGATSQTVGAVTIGDGTIQNGTLTASSFTSTGGTVSANLAGASAALTHNSGTLRLSGANTYGGGTTVSGGSLRVANASGSAAGTGNVTLNGGTFASGTAGGGGSISGSLLAGSAPHVISPGGAGTSATGAGTTSAAVAIGTLTVGGLTLNNNSTLYYEFNTSAVTNDQITDTGALTYSNTGAGSQTTIDVPLSLSAGTYRLIGGFATTNLPAGPNPTGLGLAPIGGGSVPTNYSLNLNLTSSELDLVVVAADVPVAWSAPLSANVHAGSTANVGATLANNGVSTLHHTDYTVSASGGSNITYTNPASVDIGAGASQSYLFSAATTGTAAEGPTTVTLSASGTGVTSSPVTTTATLTVYDLAAANTIGAVNFGPVHAGATITQPITLTNTAPTDATYTETLTSNGFSNTTTGFTATGTVATALVAGGTSDTTDLVVGTGASLAFGHQTGTTTLALASNEVNGSGLGTTNLTGQIVNISADVYSGKAQWSLSADGDWLTQSNWADTQSSLQFGTPGISGIAGDTATFGGSGTTAAAIDISTANPSLAAITFNAPDSGLGFTITRTSGTSTNRVTLSGGPATVNVNDGTHDAIAAPLTVDVGGVTISGNGVLALSGSGNVFNGPVAVVGTVKTTISGTSAFNYASSSPASISVGTDMDTPTLVIRPTSGSTVASGVTATVAAGATLELDGTVSALSDQTTALQRASVQNNGSLVAGDLTSLDAAVQQVGGIDGAGTTTVADNASLTADHINQTALVIGNNSVFTLAPSNSDGSPMGLEGSGSSLVLAGSLAPSSSFIASSGSLLGVSGATSSASASLSSSGGASVSAVPEPTSGLLLGLGALGLFGVGAARRKKSAR